MVARRFRLGGKKEGAGAAVAVILTGIIEAQMAISDELRHSSSR